MKLLLDDFIGYNHLFLNKIESDELLEHLLSFPNLTNLFEIKTKTGETFRQNFGKMMFLD